MGLRTLDMGLLRTLLVATLWLSAAASGAPSKGKILAVLESEDVQASHTQFLASLREYGFDVTVGLSSDESLRLSSFGEWLYDHLVILAPRVLEFSRGFGVKDVLAFVDAGRNVLVAGDVGMSPKLADLAQECGIDMDGDKTRVFDHFNFALSSGIPSDDHTLIAVDASATEQVTGGMDSDAPVLFRGVAASLPPDTEMAVSGLLAPATSYSMERRDGQTLADVVEPIVGRDISLVSLVQARNNARVAVFGSLEMLSDAFYSAAFKVGGKSYDAPANKEYCFKMALWTFQERGVLVVKGDTFLHWDKKTEETPDMYRINDDIHLEVGIFEKRDGEEIPFKTEDAQLEYTMLDPHIRTNLEPDGEGFLTADFKAPDVYGVFKFILNLKKPGYTFINLVQQAPIRPFRHNEYDRFLVSAYPYYVSCFSMMVGFFILGFVYLYHK